MPIVAACVLDVLENLVWRCLKTFNYAIAESDLLVRELFVRSRKMTVRE